MTDASQASDTPTELLELGKIVGAYGIKGWVKVETFAPASESLLKSTAVWHTADGRRFDVLSCRVQGAGPAASLVAQLGGLQVRESAQALRGTSLYLPRKVLGPAETLENDTYFQVDLVGLSVQNRAGTLLGTVAGVDSHGAGEFLVVQGNDPATLSAATYLIPFRSTYVDKVDLKARLVLVDWERDW